MEFFCLIACLIDQAVTQIKILCKSVEWIYLIGWISYI